MINLPYPEIVKRIKEKKEITEEELEEKVKQKMDQLSGLISREGAAYIIANELGVKLVDSEGMKKIKDVFPGMRNVETAGKVARKFPVNEFERNGNKGRVANFIIADETGQLRMTAWHDMVDVMGQFEPGDIVKVRSGFAKDNNGQVEVHLNSNSKVLVNPEGLKIDVDVTTSQPAKQPADAVRKKISELTENDMNVEVLATVVQVFDPRFYTICPRCGKKVTQNDGGFACPEHGTIEPKYGYVMNIFIDDGSDNIRAVFFRDSVLKLIGKDDEAMQRYRVEPEKFEEIKTKLLGETIAITGRTTKNTMFDRLELMANDVDADVKPEQEIAKIKEAQGSTGSEKDTAKDEKIPSIDDL